MKLLAVPREQGTAEIEKLKEGQVTQPPKPWHSSANGKSIGGRMVITLHADGLIVRYRQPMIFHPAL